MGLPGNLALAIGGALAEGTVFVVGICSVRHVVRARRRKREVLHGELIIRRPELPAPPRKEISR